MGRRREQWLSVVNTRLHETHERMADIKTDVATAREAGQSTVSQTGRLATLAALGAASGFYDRAGELLTPEHRMDERTEVFRTIQSSIEGVNYGN